MEPRRLRAVSFTLDAQPELVLDLANAAANDNPPEPRALPPALFDADSDSALRTALNATVTSLMTLDNAKTPANELAVASGLDLLSGLLESEEERYQSSPIRSPLISCRQDYTISHLVHHVHQANIVARCIEFLAPEDTSVLELQRASGRFIAIVGETYPESFEEIDDHVTNEQLIQCAMQPKHEDLRVWYLAILGFALNDRRGRQAADLAVLPLAPSQVSLPAFLLARLRDLLVPNYLSRVSNSPIKPAELIYTLKCLAFMGEYQEILQPLLSLNIIDVIFALLQRQNDLVQFWVLEFASRLIAHKSFAFKFVQSGGVDVLLSVPTTRPIYLEASIAWCLSGLASLSTLMEKILKTVSDAPQRLVEYCLLLLKGQQDLTRKNALFFFAHALSFPVVLNEFDKADGPRVVLDLVAQPLALQRSVSVANVLKHSVVALRQYFRAHVAMAAHLVRQVSQAKRLPLFKPLQTDAKGHDLNLETLASRRVDVVSFLTQTKWRPVEELVSYRFANKNGIQLLLSLVKACVESEMSNSNVADTGTISLQILAIACILPLTHSDISSSNVAVLPDGFLRSGISTPNAGEAEDECSGLAVLLQVAAADTSDGTVPVEQIQLALEVINALVTPFWAEDAAQRANRRTARESNALHILLSLLKYKGRMADAVRALAADCLLGLARDAEVMRILAALNVDKDLSEIVNSEPMVAEHSAAHKRLQSKALALLRVVSGVSHKVEAGELSLATDAAARKIGRDAIVRRSNVQFYQHELLELIHDHLDALGLDKAAKALYDEANLGKLDLADGRKKLWAWPCKKDSQAPSAKRAKPSASPARVQRSSSVSSQGSTTPRPSPNPASLSVWRQHTPAAALPVRASQASALERLVKEHLRHQHEKCPNPISVPPPFPLQQGHKHACPDLVPKTAPVNTARRLAMRQVFPPWGGPGGWSMNTRSVHRQHLYYRNYVVGDGMDVGGAFSCCSFRECGGRDDEIVVGTEQNIVHRFNAWTAELLGSWDLPDMLNDEHGPGQMASIQLARDLMLTTDRTSTRGMLWRAQTKDDLALVFKLEGLEGAVMDERASMIVGVLGERTLGVYATDREPEPHTHLRFNLSNNYEATNVCLDKSGSLVLYDGLLWDIKRSPRPIAKFDKLSPHGYAAFNPSGLSICLNKDVWDLRTFRLLHSAPDSLDGARLAFDRNGDVLFSHMDPWSPADTPSNAFKDSIIVTDAWTCTNIASYEINRPTQCLALHPGGGHFAIVTHNDGGDLTPNQARLYEIGRSKPDDNDSDVDDAENSGESEPSSHTDHDMDSEFDIDGGELGGGRGEEDDGFGDAIMRAMNELIQRGRGELEEGEEEEGHEEEEEGEENDDGDDEGFFEMSEGDEEDDEIVEVD